MSELEVVKGKPEIEVTPTFVDKTELERKADELRSKVTLPKKPGSNVQFKDLLEWIKIVPNEGLDSLMVYAYRLYPAHNKQLVDPDADNNIDVYSGENLRHLNEEMVAETHGGGKYRFIVSDLTKKGSKEKGEGFRADLSLPTVSNPPKLDRRTVMWDDPINRGYRAWCRARNLINDKNMPIEVTTQPSGVEQSQSMVSAMKLAMEFVEKMSNKDQQELKRRMGVEDGLGKSIGDILLEKMKQDDPNKQVQTLTAMITAMKGMNPESKGGGDNAILASMMTMVTTMITTLVESSNKQSEMMMKFMEMSNSRNGDKEERDEYAKMKDILEIAKQIKGGGEKSTAEVIVEGATTLLAPALQMVNNIMAINILNKQGAKGGGMGTVPLNQTAPNPGAPPAQGATQPTAQPAVAPVGLPSPDEATSIIANYAPLIIKHLGHDGWEFGALVSDMFGDEIAAAIARFGPDQLLEAGKKVPQFWQQVTGTYGEAHLRKWLESLCNYREEARKSEEGEEGDEIIVEGGVK